jgi:hypothetical protein
LKSEYWIIEKIHTAVIITIGFCFYKSLKSEEKLKKDEEN